MGYGVSEKMRGEVYKVHFLSASAAVAAAPALARAALAVFLAGGFWPALARADFADVLATGLDREELAGDREELAGDGFRTKF